MSVSPSPLSAVLHAARLRIMAAVAAQLVCEVLLRFICFPACFRSGRPHAEIARADGDLLLRLQRVAGSSVSDSGGLMPAIGRGSAVSLVIALIWPCAKTSMPGQLEAA